MLITETLILNGREYTRTYSDTCTIQRDGMEYDEAIDPVDSGRIYTETTNTKDGEDSVDFSQKASTAYEKGVCDA